MTKQEEIQQCLDRIKALTAEPTKVEVGKVYRNSVGCVLCVTKLLPNNEVLAYGFLRDGEWIPIDYGTFINSHLFTPVPLSEWTELLDKERIKRGLISGAKIERPKEWELSKPIATIVNGNFTYSEATRHAYVGGYIIYANGIWAKVIKDEDVYVNGEKVVFNDTTVDIGNHAYSVKTLRFAHSLDREMLDKIVNKLNTIK